MATMMSCVSCQSSSSFSNSRSRMSTPTTGRTDAAVCFALALCTACLCLQTLSTDALSALNVDETGWETSSERCVLSASLLRVEDFVLTRGACVEYRRQDRDRGAFSCGVIIAIPRQALCAFLVFCTQQMTKSAKRIFPLGRKFSLVCACWVDVTVTSGVLFVVSCLLKSGIVRQSVGAALRLT